MDRRIALIVNPASGGGKAAGLIAPVEAALRARGITVRTERTTSLDHGCELAVAAVAAGDIPVTLSGDGLVGAVTGALADVDGAVMGVLPGGRGNDFARVAGIPLDALAAVEVVATGTARPVDLGVVGGRPFIGIASFGFDSDANRIANEAPARLGNLVYAYGALRALVSWRPAGFRVTVDGVSHDFHGWTVAVANSGAYGGGMMLAPDAQFDDEQLDIVLIGESSRLHFLRQLPSVFKGTHTSDPSVTILRGRTVEVDADRPFTIYADGDPIGATPATISVRPHAVQVLLP